jgi:hypothetical protein
MATPLRAFLMLKLASGEWDIRVCQTLEDLARCWDDRPDSVSGALLHIGFERAPARQYDDAVRQFAANLLLTKAAATALPSSYKSSNEPAAWSAENEPLYLATEGWGYVAEAPAAATCATEEKISWEDWIADLVICEPHLAEKLRTCGITDEVSYLKNEADLDSETRRVLGIFRAERLVGNNWDDPCQVAAAAPPWMSAMAVDQLPLTVRIGNVFRHSAISVVSDLTAYSMADLVRWANFGRTSVHQLANILRDTILAGPVGLGGSTPREVAPTLMLAVRQSLLRLDARTRDIVSRRMGLDSAAETLEEVGRSYGLTRERIRQLESKALKRIIRTEYWDDLLAAKLKLLLAGREFPLPLIGVEAVDRWFEGIGKNPRAAKYILNNLCVTPVGLVSIGGVEYLSHLDQDAWNATVFSARNLLKHAVGEHWTRSHTRMMVQGLLPREASELATILWSEVVGKCHFNDDSDDAVLVRYGGGADPVVEVVLLEAEAPLHFTEITRRASEKAGRQFDERRVHNAAHELGYLFAPGTYGLLKHVGVPTDQLNVIAEESAEIIQDGEPGKQWHASELLEELKARGVVRDDRIDKHVIDIALHEHQLLQSLGRMVWAAPGSTTDAARIEVRQALVSILQQAGEPLTTDELRQRLTAVRGINSTMQFAVVDPLIKLGTSTWGLNDRDLPVKRGDQAAMLDGIVRQMQARNRPVHIAEAELVLGCKVPARALFCLAANDARFAIGTDRKLHLRQWIQ